MVDFNNCLPRFPADTTNACPTRGGSLHHDHLCDDACRSSAVLHAGIFHHSRAVSPPPKASHRACSVQKLFNVLPLICLALSPFIRHGMYSILSLSHVASPAGHQSVWYDWPSHISQQQVTPSQRSRARTWRHHQLEAVCHEPSHIPGHVLRGCSQSWDCSRAWTDPVSPVPDAISAS